MTITYQVRVVEERIVVANSRVLLSLHLLDLLPDAFSVWLEGAGEPGRNKFQFRTMTSASNKMVLSSLWL